MYANDPNEPKKPFFQRTGFIVTCALLAALIVANLGTFQQPLNPPSASPEGSVAPTETFAGMGCQRVSQSLIDAIGQGFDSSTLMGRAAGFVASDFKDVRFVAVEFIPGGTSSLEVAVFATNDTDLNDDLIDGLIIPADGFAKEFSDWGASEKLELSIASAGAAESKECLSLR